jgi:predicted Rdx family selenoprotein
MKTPTAKTDAENVAVLTKCTQYNWGKCLRTGVLAHELLKSCGDVVL